METGLAIVLGVGLAAACGFRVFVPVLVASLATWAGHLEPSADFLWIGSTPALIALSVATALEIGAFYVPWLDNLLDMAAAPAAVIAGTLLTAAFVCDMSPMLRWGTALIAGGGAAGVTSAGMAMVRAASTATTGGLANPVVSTLETGASVGVAALAVIAPVLGVVAVGHALLLIAKRLRTRGVVSPNVDAPPTP